MMSVEKKNVPAETILKTLHVLDLQSEALKKTINKLIFKNVLDDFDRKIKN